MNSSITTIFDLPLEVMESMPPASMIYAVHKDVKSGHTYPSLCIKEDVNHLITLMSKNIFEIRVGVFNVEGVVLVPLLVQINHQEDMTYETWINYERKMSKDFLTILAQNEFIDICFFDDGNNNVKTQVVPFQIRDDIVQYLHNIKQEDFWSMDDFDYAKNTLCLQYDTVLKLWNGIGTGLK